MSDDFPSKKDQGLAKRGGVNHFNGDADDKQEGTHAASSIEPPIPASNDGFRSNNLLASKKASPDETTTSAAAAAAAADKKEAKIVAEPSLASTAATAASPGTASFQTTQTLDRRLTEKVHGRDQKVPTSSTTSSGGGAAAAATSTSTTSSVANDDPRQAAAAPFAASNQDDNDRDRRLVEKVRGRTPVQAPTSEEQERKPTTTTTRQDQQQPQRAEDRQWNEKVRGRIAPNQINNRSEAQEGTSAIPSTTTTTTTTTTTALTTINAMQVGARSTEKVQRRYPDAPTGPRAVHVPGPQFHLHDEGSSSSLSLNNDLEGNNQIAAEPTVAATSSRTSPDAAVRAGDGGGGEAQSGVPVATLVTEKSVKLVEATEEDASWCNRRNLTIIIAIQVVIVIIVVVVVVSIVGGEGGGSSDNSEGVPTSQPTVNLFPTTAPSISPTAYPEPEECIFDINAVPPQIPDIFGDENNQLVNLNCQAPPRLVAFEFVGGTCEQTTKSDCQEGVVSCRDFPANGGIPTSPSDQSFFVRGSGIAQNIFLGNSAEMNRGGVETLGVENFLEIHSRQPPPTFVAPENSTTLLQRVEFNISCIDQSLCFNNYGAFSVIEFDTVNANQGGVVCEENVEYRRTIPFQFDVSIEPKLPQGEDTANITSVQVTTSFSDVTDEEGVPLADSVLTTSNRTLSFSFEKSIDLRFSRDYTFEVSISGLTNKLGLPCQGTKTVVWPIRGATACPTDDAIN